MTPSIGELRSCCAFNPISTQSKSPMANQFIPLLALPAPISNAFRPGLIGDNAATQPPASDPMPSDGRTSMSHQLPASACASGHPPELNFKRDGDRITQIQIRCACGESIVLDCNYAVE